MSEATKTETKSEETTKKARGGRPAKCTCGCGEVLKPGRRFKQGHDARFHGNAKAVARGQKTMGEATKGMSEKALVAFRAEVASHREATPSASA